MVPTIVASPENFIEMQVCGRGAGFLVCFLVSGTKLKTAVLTRQGHCVNELYPQPKMQVFVCHYNPIK